MEQPVHDKPRPVMTESAFDHGADPEFTRYYEQASLSESTRQRFCSVRDKALALLAARGCRGALRVIDVGCGAGTQSVLWAEMGHSVCGLDVSAPLIGVARRRAAELGLPIRYEVGTATALPLGGESVDVCLLPELLEHVADWEGCLKDAIRVLAPGGLLYLSTTNWLCPAQQEFSLPLYSWYPPMLKRYCERLAVTTRPQWVNHARYPAVNWFSFYRLRSYLNLSGFECLDRFDMIEPHSVAARVFVGAIRRSAVLRFAGHVCTQGVAIFAIRRTVRRNS